MLTDIQTFKDALAGVRDIDLETRGALVELGLAIAEKTGEPYTYGLPGSDPNVEELRDGNLRITLITPIRSGTEVIEFLHMRVPNLGDSKALKVSNDDNVGEMTQGLIEKLQRVCVVDGSNRKLAASEIEKITDEDGRTLGGAIAFLGVRFRRTGKTFKIS